jgi:hypothetical protein
MLSPSGSSGGLKLLGSNVTVVVIFSAPSDPLEPLSKDWAGANSKLPAKKPIAMIKENRKDGHLAWIPFSNLPFVESILLSF